MFDHLTNILYVAVFIIAMFIESDVDLELMLVMNVLDLISTSSNSIESVMMLSLVEFRIARSHDYFVIYLFIYLVIFFLHLFVFILFITFINWV